MVFDFLRNNAFNSGSPNCNSPTKFQAGLFSSIAFVLFWIFSSGSVSAQALFSGTTMGPIEYNVAVYDLSVDRQSVETGIQRRLEQVNQLMSTYIESSDVTRVNNASAETWVAVDPLTLSVVSKALGFSHATQGAFDITVGPAVKFWKFGPESSEVAESIDELQEYVGYGYLQIRKQPPALKKSHNLTQIDLSAIAKGFAVDRVADWLLDQGISNFKVDVGGEVVTSGRTSKGDWRIGIERPDEFRRSVATVVKIRDQAIATSGDYRNFRIENGKRLSHAIDPVSCQCVDNGVASVSIIADDCLTADAVATAVMVMGPEKGEAFCKAAGYEYLMMVRSKSNLNHFEMIRSDSFPELVLNKKRANRNIWPVFVATAGIFGLAIAGMAIGAIVNNKPIKGSCGGIAAQQNEDGSTSCSLCHKPVSECPEKDNDSTSPANAQ